MDNKKQPHLAIYLGSMQKGGTERVIANLTEHFIRQGWDISLVTIYSTPDEYKVCGVTMPGPTECDLLVDGDIKAANICGGTPELPGKLIRYYSEIDGFGENRLSDFIRRVRKLRRIWKCLHPDVILACMAKNNLMAIQSSRGLGIPVAVQVCAQPELEYPAGPVRISEKILFPKASGVILQTEGSKAFFEASVRRRSKVLKNIVADSFINAEIPEIRDKVIIAVGRMDDNKRHELIIRSFAEVEDQIPGYSLVIYGDGPDRRKLTELVSSLGMVGRIKLPGVITDVADAMKHASLFVIASDSEGIPNTLLEAMCMGLPCIATDCICGGMSQLIEDGVNGCVIPVGDGEALSDRILRITGDSGLSEKLGKNALKMREIYSTDSVCNEWTEYLMGLIGNGNKK